jgi:hypothetical protein
MVSLQRLTRLVLGPRLRLPMLVATYGLIYWAILVLKPGAHHTVATLYDAIGLLGTLAGASLALRAWWRTTRSGSARTHQAGVHWAPLLIGISLVCNLVANTIWDSYDLLTQDPPFPSWADPVYLCYYPLLLAAILLIPRARLQAVVQARITVDGLIALCAVVTFSWYFVLGPTFLQREDSMLARCIGTAYPLGDVLLIVCLMLIWSRTSDTGIRPAVLSVTFGLCCMVVADTLFDYQSLQGTYETGSLFDPLWSLSDLLVGLGAVWLSQVSGARAVSPESAEPPTVTAMSTWRGLVPYALLPAVGLSTGVPGSDERLSAHAAAPHPA